MMKVLQGKIACCIPVFLYFCICIQVCYAQGVEWPQKGEIRLGIQQTFMNDRDISPNTPIDGWVKGEINRRRDTDLTLTYGLMDFLQVQALLGGTNIEIGEVRSSLCDYNNTATGISAGVKVGLLYFKERMFLVWSQMAYLRSQYDDNFYINEWELYPFMIGLKFKQFMPYAGIAYTNFRVHDRVYEFEAEEKWEGIIGIEYKATQHFSMSFEAKIVPESKNKNVGNDNGIDGATFVISLSYAF
jgi:Outer membrane protein beta-barrel domain